MKAPPIRRLGVLAALGAVAILAVVLGTRTLEQAPVSPSFQEVDAKYLASPSRKEAEVVPLIRLISAPQSYDGKSVRTMGYARVEFEGEALYVHKEDFEHLLLTNSVGLRLPSLSPFQPFSDRYVIVEGEFQAAGRGRTGLQSGTIREISRFVAMPTRAMYESQR